MRNYGSKYQSMQDNQDLPPIECLQCFVAAATHLNFRRAAGSIALSPQAFSSRIRQLEELLGQALFARTTRTVALTSAGERFQLHARRIIKLVGACRGVVEGGDASPTQLTLGTRYELGRSWLAPALMKRREDRPSETVHLSFGDGPALQQRLVLGAIDAMVSSSRLENLPFDFEAVHDEEYRFVASPSLLATTPLRRARDLRNHTLLDEREDRPLFRYLQDSLRTDDWRFHSHVSLGTTRVIHDWVLAAKGVAVLPEYQVRTDLARGKLVQVLPRHALGKDSFRLIWRHGSALEPFLRSFATELRTYPLQ